MRASSSRTIGDFDYIIVGAGSAGCVLANRLSADPQVRVLLLEAGGKDNNIWIKVPLGLFYLIGNPRTDWCYQTEPEPECNGRQIPVPRGRMLGGSSSINGMVYVRGQPRDYDVWRQLGNAGWAWDNVLPYFKKSEDFASGGDDLHGCDGELRVEDARVRWEILDAFRDAAEQVGIPKTNDYNAGNYEGSAYFQVTQRRGSVCRLRRHLAGWATPQPAGVDERAGQGRAPDGARGRHEFWQGETLTSADGAPRGDCRGRRDRVAANPAARRRSSSAAAPAWHRGAHELAGVGENRRTTANRASFFACATPRRSMRSRTAISAAPS